MAGAKTKHSVILTWSSNAPSFRIYKVNGIPKKPKWKLVNKKPVTVTTFTDTGVANGNSYSYVVTAVDSQDKESGYSNQVTAVIPAQ